jgi:N4-(beta-N-acetylglucosaminyl)-L-asparaginase
MSTWPWPAAAEAGFAALTAAQPTTTTRGRAARLDAVVAAAAACERSHCGGPGHGAPGTVGPGGSPDENGATTLDAVVVDGPTAAAGGVGCLSTTPAAAAAARAVLERTSHTLLVGPGADTFAAAVGLPSHANLSTPASLAAWRAWRGGGACQPNFWAALPGLAPDPRRACGPYRMTGEGGGVRDGTEIEDGTLTTPRISAASHDTLAVVVLDAAGSASAGASSNGAAHKIPGRVGDAAIPGGGAYATPDGGCGATGDGDAHLRFLPCAHALALVGGGLAPGAAAEAAIRRMAAAVPGYTGALIVAASKTGEVGAAAAGWGGGGFAYALVRGGGPDGGRAQVVAVPNLKGPAAGVQAQ